MKRVSLFLLFSFVFCFMALGEAAEQYGKVLPDTVGAEPIAQSAANADGEVVELLRRADIQGEVLALRRKDGSRLFLYHRNPVGEFPAQPGGWMQHIYWLTPDSFACVCSGRRLSDYVLYQLDPDDDAPGTLHVWKENSGSYTFRVDWQVVEGKLVATHRGRTLMVLTPLSAAQ